MYLKRISLILFLSASIASAIILFFYFIPEPPAEEMNSARKSLSAAFSSGSDKYSPRLYNQASMDYDSAMAVWQRENRKLFFFRDYDKVRSFAGMSEKKSREARAASMESSTTLSSRLAEKIDSLYSLVERLDTLFDKYPLTEELRNRISKGKMLYEEGVIAYNKGIYLQANLKITDSWYLLTESYENANENLKNYFNSYPEWKKWIDLTISASRKNNDYSIIIDKFSRKCFVYHSGKLRFEFDAELGKNWVGDKRVSGDKATPEGMYKITRKFDSRKTKYYKALLINYPNDEDTARFKSDIERGSLPRNSKIGGLIEIHGNGGKGTDWTDGCVALTDKDMDLVYRIARIGTPVTIIGSMTELESIINNKK